jgi:dienelactone hydrolase
VIGIPGGPACDADAASATTRPRRSACLGRSKADRWLVGYTIVALVAPLITATVAAQAPDAAAVARAAAIEFAEAKYSELYARFDTRMRSALTESTLRQVLARQITGTSGAFVRVDGSTACRAAGESSSCDTPLLFEEARLTLRVGIDPRGQVNGLFIAAMEPRPSAGGLTVPAGDVRLPAVLTLPDGDGPHPVVVLVHGSGEHDGDETIGPNKPFRDLAEGLMTRGVGTLRYFKRGRLTPLPATATLADETIDDALSALRLARDQPGVDPRRVYVLGHSLGGYLAPHLASRDSRIRGIVIMAGNNGPMRESVLDQVRHVTGSEEGFEKVWNSLPQRYRDGLPGYDPPAVAQSLSSPILVLQGGRDYQVTMKDFERWRTALDGRPNVALRLYPRLNHLFIDGDGISMPAEYMTPGRVADAVIDDIAAWIRSH